MYKFSRAVNFTVKLSSTKFKLILKILSNTLDDNKLSAKNRKISRFGSSAKLKSLYIATYKFLRVQLPAYHARSREFHIWTIISMAQKYSSLYTELNVSFENASANWNICRGRSTYIAIAGL